MEAGMAQHLNLAAGSKIWSSYGELEVIGTFPNPSGEPLCSWICPCAETLQHARLIDRVDLVLAEEQGFETDGKPVFRSCPTGSVRKPSLPCWARSAES
jgi:putative ABC transport system permease protein